MPTAFILINTEVAGEREVLKALKKVPGVTEAHALWGVYDIIARVEVKSMDRLRDVVINRIRRLDKVRSTLTMVTVKG